MFKKQFKKSGRDPKASASDVEPSRDAEQGGFKYTVQSGLDDDHGGVRIVEDEERNLSRSLSQRHIQMIALAGAIVRSSFPRFT
jgi:amino acid permease